MISTHREEAETIARQVLRAVGSRAGSSLSRSGATGEKWSTTLAGINLPGLAVTIR